VTKRELYDEKLEDALEMLDLKWSKDDDTKTQPSASARTRSACRNQHKSVFRSRDTERRVCQNPVRVATLGRTAKQE